MALSNIQKGVGSPGVLLYSWVIIDTESEQIHRIKLLILENRVEEARRGWKRRGKENTLILYFYYF